jgi:hypothetical protein
VDDNEFAHAPMLETAVVRPPAQIPPRDDAAAS